MAKENGVPFYVMERLEGETLADFLARRGKLSLKDVLVLLGPAAEAHDHVVTGSARQIIVADDHPLFRTAIKEALEADQGQTTFLEDPCLCEGPLDAET